MATALTDKLSGLVKKISGQARITESNVQDMLREVRMALLEADVALPVVRDFIARVKDKALGQEVLGSLKPGQALVGIVNRELAATMGEGVSDLNLAAQPPAVILMAGLQGAGKTTTTAKLARHLISKRKKKVLTVSGDVYRPAAIEQLKTVTAQAGADWFPSSPEQKPVDIARAALTHARTHFYDVLLVDSAGRLAIDEALMAEIQALHAALNPVETLFVVDAMQGQDAANTAKAFKDALPLTGIVLTKMDGDARGGAALSVRQSPARRSSLPASARRSTAWRCSTPSATPAASWAWATCWRWSSRSPPTSTSRPPGSWPRRSRAAAASICRISWVSCSR